MAFLQPARPGNSFVLFGTSATTADAPTTNDRWAMPAHQSAPFGGGALFSVSQQQQQQPHEGIPVSAAAAGACSQQNNLQFIGAYVPADSYARGGASAAGCSGSAPSLSAYAANNAAKVAAFGQVDLLPGNASGLSSRSLETLGGAIPYGSMVNADAAAKARADPFAGVVIPKTRDVAMLDNVQGAPVTYLTTNFNQTYDLRGDIPVPVTQAPPGASIPTHGAFAEVYPYRGYVY